MVEVAGEVLHLLPDRAVYWPAASALLLADLHLGKADHFRAAGVPVPFGPTQRDLARLDTLCDRLDPAHVVVLGDLFHARGSHTDAVHAALADFRARHASRRISLVRGNHDRHAGPPPTDLRIEDAGDRLALGPFTCTHEPTPMPGTYVLAGHVHPAVRLRDARSRRSVRVPCFHFTADAGTLPPFGTFTGHHVLTPSPTDRVFAVPPGGGVIDVSPNASLHG